MDPYEELANAIIVTAANDYRRSLRHIKRNPTDGWAIHYKRECERFFGSRWFTALTSVDGKYLAGRLVSEDGVYRRRKRTLAK